MDKIEPIVIPINIDFDDIDKYYVKDPETIFVHLSKDEAKMLDTMIGGVPEIDEMGVRDYSKLSDVIANPQIREMLKDTYNDLKRLGKPRTSILSMYEATKKPEGKFHPMPGDKNPIVEDQAEEGMKGDSLLVLLPKDFIILWSILRGALVINPKTELLMFGFFKNPFKAIAKIVLSPVSLVAEGVGRLLGKKNWGDEALRIVGPIAGFMAGGPMGAALGSAGAHWLTGNSLKNSAIHGLKSYGMASLAKGAASMAGFQLPGMAATKAPIVYGGKAATEYAARQAAASGANAAAGTAAQQAAAAAPSFMDKIASVPGKAFDFLTSGPGIAMAAAVPLLMSGHKKHKRDVSAENAANEARWNKGMADAGMTAKLRDPVNMYDDTNTGDKYGNFTGKYVDTKHVYKSGGKVKSKPKAIDLVNISVAHEGEGKGQADNIKFDPPANGYYWDASTTSMLGDGNTSAGLKILKNFERNILRNYKGPKIDSMIEKVPAAVSDGEFLQSPLTVTIIGAGSNKKGAKILDMVRENIRRHKSKNGGGLPPKAKPLESYFPKKMKG